MTMSHKFRRRRDSGQAHWLGGCRRQAELLEDRRLLAASPEFVADLVPGRGSHEISNFVAVGSVTYFMATDVLSRHHLWKTDGTAAGTVPVWSAPTDIMQTSFQLTSSGGTLFFVGTDAAHGSELWKSDGTATGTVRVKDIVPGNASAHPASLTDVDGILYFSVVTENGSELWKSDGTAAGTVFLKGFARSNALLAPYQLKNVGGQLFFVADDSVHGVELWKSDGTEAGTVLVQDIWQGSASAEPAGLTAVGDTVYFFASSGDLSLRSELWKSDGTVAGTAGVKSFPNDVIASRPHYLTRVSGRLFFVARGLTRDDKLWKSDGTEAGTVPITTVGQFVQKPIAVGDTLFFPKNDGVNGELWRSDGTAEGTVLLKQFSSRLRSPAVFQLTNVEGTLFFSGADDASGRELWKSDGTVGGTVLAADILPGPASSVAQALTYAAGNLYFTAYDSEHGYELWKLRPDPLPGHGPTDVVLSSSSVQENQPIGTAVGVLSTVDLDVGDKFTYSLVAGTGDADNASFTIDGQGTLRTAAVFDAGIKSSYTIRVRSTDLSGFSFERQFTIVVDHQLMIVPGDFDGDYDVDAADMLTFLENWTGALQPNTGGKTLSNGDLDADADVDSADLLIFLANWSGVQNANRLEPAAVPVAASAAVSSEPAGFQGSYNSPDTAALPGVGAVTEPLAKPKSLRPNQVDRAFTVIVT